MDVQSNRVVPDGGYGWIVVLAVAIINMTNQSILSVFGQLFVGQLQTMHGDTFTAALITNLNSLALNFSGLFIGPAIKSFKPRNVAAFGVGLVAFGLALCSLATECWHFIIGYSLFVGFGLGLISPSTFMAINSYFSSKRGRAVGVSLAGAGVGQVIIPHVVRYFLHNYGFRYAVLAMSALSLTGLIGAIFLKPLNPSNTKHNNRKHMRLLAESDSKKNTNSLQTVIVDPAAVVIPSKPNKPETIRSKMCHRLVQAMDLELLQDIAFLSIVIGLALVYTTTINFTMIFPSFLKETAELGSDTVALCMSIVAGADIVCRLALPCITDRLRIPYRVVFLMGTIGLLVARCIMAGSTNFAVIVAMSIIMGGAKSATVINNNLTISAFCRAEKLAGGLGLSMISKGLIVITIGQMLGWIRDFADSYVICFYAQSAVLLVVVATWTPEILYRLRREGRKRTVSKSIDTTVEAAPEEIIKINSGS